MHKRSTGVRSHSAFYNYIPGMQQMITVANNQALRDSHNQLHSDPRTAEPGNSVLYQISAMHAHCSTGP